ncbi:MAG: PAS domain S-box protein [Betaproteobacteria bacterium]
MKTSRHSIAGIVIIALALLAYVSFLLTTNYTSQTNLQQTLLEQFRMENGWRATALSFFFKDRCEDMINLASHREIEVFFENRALGMSMEYGLRRSIPPIKKRFIALLNHDQIDQETAYNQIVLIDEKGTVLVQASAPDRAVKFPTDMKRFVNPEHRNGEVIAEDRDRTILISVPYFFKGKYTGQIVAWINPNFIADHVLIPQGAPERTTRLVTNSNSVYLPVGSPPVPGVQDRSDGLPIRFEEKSPRGTVQDMVGLSTPVKDTPLFLLTVGPANDILGGLKPRGLLLGMGVLAVTIIGGGFIIARIMTRSLVLQTRLDVSLQHEQSVQEKNRQLENEINERMQAENALRQSEEQYRTLVETSPDIIFTLSLDDGIIRSLNTAFEQVTGWSRHEWLGRPFLDILHPDDRALARTKHQEAMNEGGVLRYELRCLVKSGEYRVTELTTTALRNNETVVGKLGIARDITERNRLEEQLRHAVKMQAVGQLAGGIAHDFNNILSVIIGSCELLLMDLPRESPHRSKVELLLSSAERGAQLTRNLLTFSRKQIITMRPGDLNEMIRTVEPLISRLIREDVHFVVKTAPGELWCLSDSTQIEQVLMNLAANASDAMVKGGRLTMTTSRMTMDSEFKRVHGFGHDGDYALLRVDDSGFGMDNETRKRIFEPFFTTKEVGKGTGLGLATVFGIVKQHHGYIDVRSQVGKGTTFTIYLPLITEDSVASDRVESSLGGLIGGSETILIAEDDEAVRAMLKSVLCSAGYRVVEARDGQDAEIKFREHRNRVSLLVFDVIMPRKNGKQAYDAIRSLCSDIKCLFLSGYTADITGTTGISEEEGGFLQKPVIPSVLLSKIREILDSRTKK